MNDTLSEIKQIGLHNVAAELNTTPQLLEEKLKNPRLFILSDIDILQTKFEFTDNMIRNLLQC